VSYGGCDVQGPLHTVSATKVYCPYSNSYKKNTFGAQVRMTRLPGVLTEALRLVDELSP
jgi:hypothetical protein